jgi:hypothetical protein
MKQLLFKLSMIVVIVLTTGIRINCQSNPEDYKKGTVPEQLELLKARTRIFDNYRSIREDVFQLICKNASDSIVAAKKIIKNLTKENATLNNRIDSIYMSLEIIQSNLEETTRTKNSISVLGMEINKIAYNSITWIVIAILVLLLFNGYMIFRINRNTMAKAKNELSDLQKEYEEYRKKKSVEHQQTTMAHFNEIKKLKEEFGKSKR